MVLRPSSSQRQVFQLLAVPVRRSALRRLPLQAAAAAAASCHHPYSTIGGASSKRGRPLWMEAAASTGVRWQVIDQQQWLQRRGLASAAGEGEGAPSRGVLTYKGGHGDVIRTLKRVSLTTCVIGLASSPFFLALGSEAVPMAANAALTGVVLLATCGPTVLLHAFTKPYIFSLRTLPPPADAPADDEAATTTAKPPTSKGAETDPHFRAETMDFLTRRAFSEFKLSEVKPLPQSTRPFVTFQARDRLYFVHGETFPDKELLVKLLGRPLKEAESVPVEPPFDEEAGEEGAGR